MAGTLFYPKDSSYLYFCYEDVSNTSFLFLLFCCQTEIYMGHFFTRIIVSKTCKSKAVCTITIINQVGFPCITAQCRHNTISRFHCEDNSFLLYNIRRCFDFYSFIFII